MIYILELDEEVPKNVDFCEAGSVQEASTIFAKRFNKLLNKNIFYWKDLIKNIFIKIV